MNFPYIGSYSYRGYHAPPSYLPLLEDAIDRALWASTNDVSIILVSIYSTVNHAPLLVTNATLRNIVYS